MSGESKNMMSGGCTRTDGGIGLLGMGAERLDQTLTQRGERYGDYGRMATVAQHLKEAMGSRAHLTAVERESLDVIATKIARIVCGEPLQRDSWHDIQGYAKLAEDRCPLLAATP